MNNLEVENQENTFISEISNDFHEVHRSDFVANELGRLHKIIGCEFNCAAYVWDSFHEERSND